MDMCTIHECRFGSRFFVFTSFFYCIDTIVKSNPFGLIPSATIYKFLLEKTQAHEQKKKTVLILFCISWMLPFYLKLDFSYR